MKNYFKIIGILMVTLLCANFSFSQVTSDYDKTTDFSKYKTYTFAGWQKDSDKILTPFDKDRIQSALKAEFDSRGMQLVESNGDAEITLYIVVEDKTSTTAYTNYVGGMNYGGRWGWGMGGATTSYSEDDYRQGTFVVDLYDANTKQLAWQGVIQSVVQEKPEKRDKSIPKKIKKLMAKYPVKAAN
ncbi:DUF4136 domain-containing protein [Gelidibacter sp.]|uniref:DUF4136 domain-containing protein n=1 Tax=Gelidibacter sp. TaxID=2018083 RepID=UPI002C43FFE1|nr:DUF4136 domain-containing protein [Gelidibacter sp.]HUH27690.1 DUF4136 domain-containing protein [Gelidibacter sp.]